MRTTNRNIVIDTHSDSKQSHAAAAATPQELARARQTGRTVTQLRKEEERIAASILIDKLLMHDKDPMNTLHGILDKETRWALHLAVGVLKSTLTVVLAASMFISGCAGAIRTVPHTSIPTFPGVHPQIHRVPGHARS